MFVSEPRNLATLSDARSKASIKQQLLGDPYKVAPHDMDSDLMDTTLSHRNAMRTCLYGRKRSKNPTISTNEALSTSCNYADEILPKWNSTMIDEYPARSVEGNRNATAQALKDDMINSHFVMGSTQASDDLMLSSTKKDFINHNCSVISI
jgi:hypothetical protein